MNIFDCAKRYNELLTVIEDNDAVITDEQADELMATQSDVELKLMAYKGILKLNDSKINVIKDEIQNLQRKIKSLENINKKIKEFSLFAINEFGYTEKDIRKYKTDNVSVYIKATKVCGGNEDDKINYQNVIKKQIVEYKNITNNAAKVTIETDPNTAKEVLHYIDHEQVKIDVKLDIRELVSNYEKLLEIDPNIPDTLKPVYSYSPVFK